MKKSHIVTLAIVGLLALVFPTTESAADPMGSSVSLVEMQALSISNVSPLVFGVFTIPNDDVAFWTMDPSGNLYPGGGNSFDPIAFDHASGSFDIMGQAGMQVFFDVAVTTDFAGDDLTLTNLTMNPGSPQTLASGPLIIEVGGELVITPFATPGGYDAIITILVNY